uniref:Uncharacterized protein n=1 Tax=Meloidogyne javanica TaxID=6303 RepID=A0A915N9V2_MELJA
MPIGDVSFPNVPLIEAKSGIPKMDKSISGSFGLSPENNDHLTSILSQLDKQIVTIKIAGGISGGGGIISAGIGLLTLGGEDKGCKNYKYVKASCDWSTGLQVGSLDNLPKIRMSDSLPNMYGPKGQIDALAKGLGVPIPSNAKERYVFPCKKNMPDITFTVGVLGGTTANVILKPDQYIEKTFNETGEVVKTTCQLYFMPNEALPNSNDNIWTMGQAFMFNRYALNRNIPP